MEFIRQYLFRLGGIFLYALKIGISNIGFKRDLIYSAVEKIRNSTIYFHNRISIEIGNVYVMRQFFIAKSLSNLQTRIRNLAFLNFLF